MNVEDSILNSVKKLCGIDPEVKDFDPDIIININAAIAVLTQLGIGPKEGFVIRDETSTYLDFVGDDLLEISMVKDYLYAKTKIGFDNSSLSGGMLETMKEITKELEWRLNVRAESDE